MPKATLDLFFSLKQENICDQVNVQQLGCSILKDVSNLEERQDQQLNRFSPCYICKGSPTKQEAQCLFDMCCTWKPAGAGGHGV